MSTSTLDLAQLAVLDRWFPQGHEVVRDLGWGLVETTVLLLRTPGGEVVLKAGGPSDHHIAREIDGYAAARQPWTAHDLAPTLLHADRDARLLAVSVVPGLLADGSPRALDPDVHRQAGAALAALHAGPDRSPPTSSPSSTPPASPCSPPPTASTPTGVAWLTAWLEAYGRARSPSSPPTATSRRATGWSTRLVVSGSSTWAASPSVPP